MRLPRHRGNLAIRNKNLRKQKNKRAIQKNTEAVHDGETKEVHDCNAKKDVQMKKINLIISEGTDQVCSCQVNLLDMLPEKICCPFHIKWPASFQAIHIKTILQIITYVTTHN